MEPREYVSACREVRVVTVAEGPFGPLIRDLVDPTRIAHFDETSRRWIKARKGSSR